MFALPWAWILLVPAVFAWVRWYRHGHGRWLRAIVVLLLVAAASGPSVVAGQGGSDVVLVLDRSASMPDAEQQRQAEMVRLVADQRGRGDRLAVIAFGDRPLIAQGPQATARPRLADTVVDADGSSLGDALETALALIAPGRSARIFVHSDGEITGLPLARATARLAAAGIPTDVLPVVRPPAPDAAILEVEVPGTLRLGESFIGAVRIISDAHESRRWRVRRGERLVAEGQVSLKSMQPAIIPFADRPDQAGLANYTIELEGAVGFARPARIDPERLRTALRSGLAGAAISSEQLTALLDDPAVQSQLQALADPTLRAAALTALRPQLSTMLPAIAVDAALSQVEAALASAVVTDDDRQPANNHARAAIRIAGGERVLVIGGDGKPGNVANAISAAGMLTTVRAAGPVTLGDLIGVSAVVLDDVPADTLTASGLTALAQWTEHLGGGLLMTGGRRSFGAGGYRRSPIEDILPVTLELRDEHRKLACSIAIAIDVSGSMMATVADGRTKLEIAAEGAAAVVELLGGRDQVAVFAVDSAPTTVVPMQPVADRAALTRQIIGMQPGGGGIFVYEALAACAQAQLASTSGTRHIILFADAADAEEPGDYQRLLDQLGKAGVTVSCIGLGSERDSDAQLLIDVARRGGGRCTFAEAAEDIPRLFAQETVLVARSAWVDQPAPLAPRADLDLLLGRVAGLDQPWPQVPGYNLTYLRDRAQLLAQAEGDPTAPAIAAWRIGTGRSVAMPFATDAGATEELLTWPGYAPLLASLVRWTAGGGDQAALGRLTATLHGRDAILRVELDPTRRPEWPATPPVLALVTAGGTGVTAPPVLQPVEDGVWEARYRLSDDRAVIPAADLAGTALLGPALCLPYSAEAEPRFDRDRGVDVLSGLARSTGGRVRQDLLASYANPPSLGLEWSLAPWLVIAAAVLLVAEIAVRRLRLGRARRTGKPAAPATDVKPAIPAAIPDTTGAQTPTSAVTPPAAPESAAGLHEALRQLRKRGR